MHRLHQTLAFLIWSILLLQSSADEEAPWGTTQSTSPTKEKPPGYKQSLYAWLPSIKIKNPFSYWGGGSDSNEDGNTLTTTYKGLAQIIDQSEEISGSGDEGISETSEPPTSATRPTGTSNPASSRTTGSDNDRLVSASYSLLPSISSTDTPHSTNAAEKYPTETHTTWGSIQADTTSLGVTEAPKEYTDKEIHFMEKMDSTIAHRSTVKSTIALAQPLTTTLSLDGATRQYLRTTIAQKSTIKSTIALTQPMATTLSFDGATSQYLSTSIAQKSTIKSTIALAQPMATTLSLDGATSHFSRSTVPEKSPAITQPFDSVKTESTEMLPTQSEGTRDREGVGATTAIRIDGGLTLESITSTTGSLKVNFPIAGEEINEEDQKGSKDEELESSIPRETQLDVSTVLPDHNVRSGNLQTRPPQGRTETPFIPQYTDWIFTPADSDATYLPDCNKERTGICNMSDAWDTTTAANVMAAPNNSTVLNESNNLFPMPVSPLLVPLYTDWNSAMAVWGFAWDVHVYGMGCIFATLTLSSALNLLCLPLRCPSGCGYFALVSLFLLAAGCTRSFSLLYDAYGHLDRIPSAEASLMLFEAPFPCITAAFGLVFLLLSMRSRMQLSYSAFQRPCFLASLVTLHFAAAFGPETLLKFYQNKQHLCLFFILISRGAFVVLATFLSSAFFVFYIYVRADSKHIYHLNNTSPTPAERYNRCPFAESRDWDRAAATVCLSALFSLACAGLQLYAMLNAMGIAGGETVFYPWSWWTFQFSCRLCELVVCLTLAFVVAQPVYCSDHLPAAGSCWTELLASKSPILPGTYQWSLSQQEKLAIVDTVGLGETESLPLYTLMDDRFANSLNGLDLLYHSNRALAYRDLELDFHNSLKPEDVAGGEPSGGSSFTSDSTTDLRPPSPINLRRSIDEALFSEALFPMSLFSPAPIRCSDQSISNTSAFSCDHSSRSLTADPGLYRTSSCVEMGSKQTDGDPSQEETILTSLQSPSLTPTSSVSSPEHWGRSSSSCSLYQTSLGGSSLLLSPSPARQQTHSNRLSIHMGSSTHLGSADPQRQYQTMGPASQETLNLSSEADRSVQEEFISVCRQIDALSICSETIDL